MSTHPKGFISYSWDDDPHKQWVADLAAKLRSDGIDTHLDQWHAIPGDQLPHFMEREIRENQHVIVICTPNYKRKSDNRTGGVGYEGDIMTAEVHTTQNHRKFVPVLARGSWTEAAPSWLAGKYYVDLSDPSKFANNYQDLLSTIMGTRKQAPPLGAAPTSYKPPSSSPPMNATTPAYDPVRIEGVIVDEVTEPRRDGTPGSLLYVVPFRLSREPSNEWIQLFLRAWQFPRQFTTMHRPGIARVYGDRIILNGTTIEEVQQYHKATLSLCVSDANEKEAQLLARVSQERTIAQQRSEAHQKTVSDVASQIRFD